jgi:hypothetical protein
MVFQEGELNAKAAAEEKSFNRRMELGRGCFHSPDGRPGFRRASADSLRIQ